MPKTKETRSEKIWRDQTKRMAKGKLYSADTQLINQDFAKRINERVKERLEKK